MAQSLSDRPRQEFSLSDLLLDAKNPRFGELQSSQSQADILDLIVERFGVEDVLSSLAVNGYFDAEPVVCRLTTDAKAVVVEGNRRLAACLIIQGDGRASRQADRTRKYQQIWKDHSSPKIDPIPAIIFEESDEAKLLSYLGVRHISAAQPWDSYAKAVWVSRVVRNSQLTVRDVALMIGDEHQTIARLLEGYHLMQQLISAGEFDPEASVRKGRGTLTEYPFSWVYTLLGYSATRKYLDLRDEDPNAKTSDSPLKSADISKGGAVVRAMFGDKNRGRNAAIEDSRELGGLAAAFASPEKVALLESGKTLEEVQRITAPIESTLRLGLTSVRRIQQDIITGLSEQEPPSREVAEPLADMATKNRRTSAEIEAQLKKAVRGIGGSDDGA